MGTVDAPRALAVGRLDGDRIPDLVVASSGLRDVAVYPGRGDGTFGSGSRLRAGVAPTAVAIGDLDGDGKNDILVLNYGDDNLSFFRGRGDGGFDEPGWVWVGMFPTALALRDLDGDGRSEAVIGFGRGRRVAVVRVLGDGLSATEEIPVTGTAPWAVAVDDLDGDGRPEIVSANGDSANVSVLSGGGAFTPALVFGAGPDPRDVAVADFDGDGRKDVVELLGSGVAVLLNESTFPGAVPAIADFVLRPGASAASFTIAWRTVSESDLIGFRLVAVDRSGIAEVGEVRVDCRECDTGLGSAYRVVLPRPPQGRTFYVDLLHQDGTSERFGPAVRIAPGRATVTPGKDAGRGKGHPVPGSNPPKP
jgi:hypothetical protein